MSIVFLLPSTAKNDVLLTIDGDDISLSEFLCSYSRVRGFKDCTPMEYFHDFLKCKLKIADAKRKGLGDDECFRGKLGFVEYSLSHEKHTLCGMVKMQMFTYKLPQQCTGALVNGSRLLMDDLCGKLRSGVAVSDIVAKNKDSNLCFEDFGGEWIDRAFILDEINTEIDKLAAGGVSKPIYSPEGMHVVVLEGKKSGDGPAVGGNSDGGGLGPGLAEEALLVAEWEKKIGPACYACRDEDVRKYFKRNKKKYRWEYPHYKGAVVHCGSKRTASKLKKRLKKQPLERWEEIITSFSNGSGEELEFEVGLFVIGGNEYVDRLVFKCGDAGVEGPYPYTAVIGKCLDYEPEDYKDVYAEVMADCLKESEKSFFDGLESDFKVEKHLDVLKTVNCSASN